MASKGSSRWEDGEVESSEAIAQRKREREDKRRAKEEKRRKTAGEQVTEQASEQASAQSPGRHPGVNVNGDVERASKRLKTSDEAEPANGAGRGSQLLTFPTKRFGRCRSVEEYDRLNDIEEGSYGLVSRARERATGAIVALKKLKMDYANDGFPVTGLREIQTLMASRHPHIVHLREVVMGSTFKE